MYSSGPITAIENDLHVPPINHDCSKGAYMIRLFTATVLILIMALSPAISAHSNLLTKAARYNGQYPFDLVEDPDLNTIFTKLSFSATDQIHSDATASPAKLYNQFLLLEGCRPEVCNEFGYRIVVDLKTRGAMMLRKTESFPTGKAVVILESNEIWKKSGHSIASLPSPLANELIHFYRVRY